MVERRLSLPVSGLRLRRWQQRQPFAVGVRVVSEDAAPSRQADPWQNTDRWQRPVAQNNGPAPVGPVAQTAD
eukprot:1647803-Lingulodinium_polyedra.AAC.1